MDHGADQTGRGAEPEERRRRRIDRDVYAERRAQRGRGHPGREHHRPPGVVSGGRVDPDHPTRGVSAEGGHRGVRMDPGAMDTGVRDQSLGYAYRVDGAITGCPHGPLRGLPQGGLVFHHGGRV
jgi:hypothetical protein